jgi:hypothetical protein
VRLADPTGHIKRPDRGAHERAASHLHSRRR